METYINSGELEKAGWLNQNSNVWFKDGFQLNHWHNWTLVKCPKAAFERPNILGNGLLYMEQVDGLIANTKDDSDFVDAIKYIVDQKIIPTTEFPQEETTAALRRLLRQSQNEFRRLKVYLDYLENQSSVFFVNPKHRLPSFGDYYYCRVKTDKDEMPLHTIIEWADLGDGNYDWDFTNVDHFGKELDPETSIVLEWLDETNAHTL